MVMHDARFVRIDTGPDSALAKSLRDFWNEIWITGDTKATTRGAMESLERQVVTDLLARAGPGDVEKAWSLSALALHLMSGAEVEP